MLINLSKVSQINHPRNQSHCSGADNCSEQCTLMNRKVLTAVSKGEMFLPLFGLKNKNYFLISSFICCCVKMSKF